MSPFLRKVKTASGATAVQIVEKRHGVRTILEHLGSAHDEAELAALMRVGHDKLHANHPALELPGERGVRPGVAVIEGKRSQLLVDVVRDSWGRLGFDAIEDEAFFQLVLARLVEPTSKLDSLRVIAELGLVPVHLSTVKRCLKRCADKGYRDKIAQACFQHVWSEQGGDVSLLLYDVTTLYFETDTEDDLRKVGSARNVGSTHRLWSVSWWTARATRWRLPASRATRPKRTRSSRSSKRSSSGTVWPTWWWSPTPACCRRQT